jgi:hypothetical protein
MAAQETVGTVGPFNPAAALKALEMVQSQVRNCRSAEGARGAGKVYVTFDPDGTVANTSIAGEKFNAAPAIRHCIALVFGTVKIHPFVGDRATVLTSFSVTPPSEGTEWEKSPGF